MANPPEEVRAFLRSLADTYTLFAFMRETPDVQSAIVKIFSDGDICSMRQWFSLSSRRTSSKRNTLDPTA